MKQGDEQAFDQFVYKYYQDILKYCLYHCNDHEYAQDLTQETFVSFFGKLSEYQYRGKTKNYLYTIAHNLCKNFYKKRKDIALDSFQFEMIDQGRDENEDFEKRMMLEWALTKIPEEYREVIILYYFEEIKLKDIARILNISLSLVKYRLRQAKLQLKKLLREGEK